MKKILLIGNGAREHVLAETIMRSPQEVELYVFAKTNNPGILALAKDYRLGNIMSNGEVVAYANEVKPDFAIVGPEDPIANGVADALLEIGVETIAPLKQVAQLEASKSFTRNLLSKYGIAGNPQFGVFATIEEARHFAEKLADEGLEFVIKADGLMAGKGVKVQGDHFTTIEEGMEFASECIEKFGRVVFEEKLVGQEFSLMSFADGLHTADMPVVQDHKRAFVDDKGPNTGGMGTYSDANHSLPFLSAEDVRAASEITRLVQKALHDETGTFFRGVMYGGFIAVKNGVRLIEYNMRFGDPEAMNTLALLQTDFIEVCEAMIAQKLDTVHVQFESKATVCKYVVPNGYPDAAVKGGKIELPADYIDNTAVKLYFGSVDATADGLVLCGSRAVAVVGIGENITEAEVVAEKMACSIAGPVFHREDIGTEKLINARVEMMKELRG